MASDTNYRCLTPEGRSGLTAFRLKQGGNPEAVLKLFDSSNPRFLAGHPGLYHGVLHSFSGAPIDEVLVSLAGQAGEFQIAGHGGAGVSRAMADVFKEAGYEPGPAVNDAFARDCYDALRRVVSIEGLRHFLLYADSEFMDSLRGLSGLIAEKQTGKSLEMIDQLCVHYNIRKGLIDPPMVCLVGLENAGKSTLFNRLVGYERVLVTDIPGTTADHVDETLVYKGFPIRFADTRGFKAGQPDTALISELAEHADYLLAIQDGTDPQGPDLSQLPAGRFIARIVNKIDLPQAISAEADDIPVSALTGRGIEELLDAVYEKTAGIPVEQLRPGCFSPGQLETFKEMQACLKSGQHAEALARFIHYFPGISTC